jgi:glycerol-3-phosphate dehydrogenase (NAD(P)+)
VIQIAVIGAGMMGSALCVPLADRGHDVRLIGTPLDHEIIRALRATGRHPGLGIELPPGVRAAGVETLAAEVADAEAIVLGVSSAGIGWAAQVLAPALRARPRPVLMVSKGLELSAGGPRVLSDVFAHALSDAAPGCAPVAICGPCIAGELARRVPTLVVLGGRDLGIVQRCAGWLKTPYYQPRISADVVGVQVCAALKNAYAMGVGLGAGLHERAGGERGSVAMHNFEAAVFAQAVVEMGALVAALGGEPASAWGLAGSGDLTVTCNGGRTGRFGALLGRGFSVARARELMASATLECLDVLAVLERSLDACAFGALGRAQLPLLSFLIELGLHDAPLEMPLEEFFRA